MNHTLVTINLIKCFAYRHTASFQFHMNQRKAIDKDRHIITSCRAILPRNDLLVDDFSSDCYEYFFYQL